jgi:hypothetical protein
VKSPLLRELQSLARKSVALEKREKAPPPQRQLQLTYSVGDWVLCRTRWGGGPSKSGAKLVARVESATRIEGADGELWVVRCYYSPDRKMRSAVPGVPLVGWGKHIEHRHIDRALNPAEIADLRRAGIIPPAGSAVLP